MRPLTIHPVDSFEGTLELPGDKSISHRMLILAALTTGRTKLIHVNGGADVQRTLEAIRQLGVSATSEGGDVVVVSDGMRSLRAPSAPIDCGNSGTTARLMLGVAAWLPGTTSFIGDPSLSQRPMHRVTEPLQQLGAIVDAPSDGLPLTITGGSLRANGHEFPTASAQVKSALLLAGMGTEGEVTVTETRLSRDHTELRMQALGIPLQYEDLGKGGHRITIQGPVAPANKPLPYDLIPPDFSAAAFWIVAASLSGALKIRELPAGANPRRLGLMRLFPDPVIHGASPRYGNEPWAFFNPVARPVESFHIAHQEIPAIIDELPLAALLATQANGVSTVQGAGDLRNKESDRLAATAELLNTLGAKVEVTDDGWRIEGPTPLHGGSVKTYGDHRIAMLGAICGIIGREPVTIDDADCIAISDPTFLGNLRTMGAIGEGDYNGEP